MIPKRYKMTYSDYQAAKRLDAIFAEAAELRDYFYKRAQDTEDPSDTEYLNASNEENREMMRVGSMLKRALFKASDIAKAKQKETFESDVKKFADKVGYVGTSNEQDRITAETIETLYQIGSSCEKLEYAIRAQRSWLLRNFIAMGDCSRRENIDTIKKEDMVESLSDYLDELNGWLPKLGLGRLSLDIIGYAEDVVQKAQDRKEGDKERAEEYLSQVWNDQNNYERKKLMTAYLDGMLAADRIKEGRSDAD